MEPRRQNVRVTALRRNARSLASVWIPDDLIPDILSRMPAKSIAKFRCVSKSWDTIIRRPDFKELFSTRSLARPQILFACHNRHEVLISSSNQLHNLDQRASSVAVNHRVRFAFDDVSSRFSHINGLLCFTYHRILKKAPELGIVVCNPSTGESIPLPRMKTRERTKLHSFFGFDPIAKQFKVLSMTESNEVSAEHQVLTLGTGGLSWRMIKCGIPHYPRSSGICINGFVYYKAAVNIHLRNSMVVCFDVRTETFSFIQLTAAFIGAVHRSATLVDYNGKLASLAVEGSDCISGKSRSFTMCVLEDPRRCIWSKGVYNLPLFWQDLVKKALFDFVGVTATNEVLLSPHYLTSPFSALYYYNLERRSIRRLAVHGLRAVRYSSRVHTYLNHVEDIKPMQSGSGLGK